MANVEVVIYEVRTGAPVATLKGHSQPVDSIAFNADGSRVVTSSWDRTLRVWDRVKQEQTSCVANDVHGPVAVTRDGKVAIGTNADGLLTAWDLQTGRRIFRSAKKCPGRGFILSDDETRVAACAGSSVIVYDAGTGKCLTPPAVPLDVPQMIAFSPDGKSLGIVHGPDDIRLWGVRSGREVRQPQAGLKPVKAIRVTDDREVCVLGIAGRAGDEVWNLTAGKKVAAAPARTSLGWPVFTRDGRVFATGRELIEWNPAAGRIERRISLAEYFMLPQILVSEDERVIMAGSRGVAVVWSAASGLQVSKVAQEGNDWPLALSPDGKHCLTGGSRSACLRDTREGHVLHDFGIRYVRTAAFSPDGRLVALAGEGGEIHLWDVKTKKRLRSLEGHRSLVRTLLFSSDSRYLASVSNDTTILVWDVRKLAPGGK